LINGQSDPEKLGPLLGQQLQKPEVTVFQLRQYLLKHVPQLSVPATAQEWTADAKQIREHLLRDVIFHGWPADWVNGAQTFECSQAAPSESGYQIRKCRYEIVPGFWSSAILYEPESLHGKVPAILSVSGHFSEGKAIEFKQKLCINYAKQGIVALNLEWLDFGELNNPENDHGYAAHLDLAGLNGVGLFYLAMRRGLDYLYQHPNVDHDRLGITGLSGGGWQTITLSSLDERVLAAVPVAGYCSLTTGIEHPDYAGNDIEENATDFRYGVDYTHLTALRAPRPTLLIYNAEDDCCFRAPIVKPYIFDQVKPFFKLFGKEDALSWHENTDPGTHNYQLDNRQQSYQFFTRNFGLPVTAREIPSAAEIKSYDELVVGLPRDNLTILGLARRCARKVQRQPIRPVVSERSKLMALVRYKTVTMKHVSAMGNTKNKGVETRSYQFQLSNDLTATGVLVRAITSPDNAPATLVLHDKGRKSASNEVSDRVNRGEQVLALDLLFTGDASPEDPAAPAKPGTETIPEYAQLLASVGERPLGIEAAQLIAIAHWLGEFSSVPKIRLESTGIRSQVVALTASALQPGLFSSLTIADGMRSLSSLFDKPVTYEAAPDLFCLDLYKEFDLDRLAALAEPTKVAQKF